MASYVAVPAKNFFTLVLKDLSGDDPNLVTPEMVDHIKQWHADSGKKELYPVSDYPVAVKSFEAKGGGK